MDAKDDRWFFAGRHYIITLASSADDMNLELDDVGPGIGRGPVAVATKPDDSKEITLSTLTSDPLPIDLISQFIGEASSRLPG